LTNSGCKAPGFKQIIFFFNCTLLRVILITKNDPLINKGTCEMNYEDKMKLLPSGIYKSYLIEKILKTYEFKNPLLEIGCGTGEFIEMLKKYRFEGELIDINQDTIEHCRKKCKKLSLNVKVNKKNFFDCESNKKVNSIFMFEVLEHIENDEMALEKVNELLNQNGFFLMSVPAKQSLFSKEDAFQGHIRRYEREDLRNKLKKAGFKIELFWCYNPLPYITRFFAKKGKAYSDIDNVNIETRTKNSSHVYFPTTKKLVDLFYPFYSRAQFILKLQNLFLKFDLGAHYLSLSKKI